MNYPCIKNALDARNGDIKIYDGEGNLKQTITNISKQYQGPKWDKPKGKKKIAGMRGRMT